MSIVRVGLSENKKFADGYEAIFGKGKRKRKAAPATTVGSKPKASAIPSKAKATEKPKPTAVKKTNVTTGAKKGAAKKRP